MPKVQATRPAEDHEARKRLVGLLQQAAQLEHCLLDAYLFTASSLKTMPQEFDFPSGMPNRRRAVQFERAREWKQKILMVAHEEMRHLHLVQCMLRALGEPAEFRLPKRDPASNTWIIPGWKAQVAGRDDGDGRGVQVPVDILSVANIQRFVLFESTDALQDDNPFGDRMTALFERLFAFEIEFRLESMVYNIPQEAQRKELMAKLREIYTNLTPYDLVGAAPPSEKLPPVEKLQFQSIADLYNEGILPLYRQAFDFGWVKHDNRNLVNELLDPNVAAEGFLPVGPIYRDMNFWKRTRAVDRNPLRDYKTVDEMIREIVEEGEGAENFETMAEAFLADVAERGVREYLTGWIDDWKADGKKPTPPWLSRGESLRQSHLYRFAMIMMALHQENDLCEASGRTFEPARQPMDLRGSVRLEKLTRELPAQFNAVYLVMLMWLQRMYAAQDFDADRDRRNAIEMLASWPMMSIAIRPFLELASFLPIDRQQLFRTDSEGLPLLPLFAQQLFVLYDAPERSMAINAEMDYLGLRTLTEVARWAGAQAQVVAESDLPEDARRMMVTRLQALTDLAEFEKQFPFRMHGGYSNQRPDLTYQQEQKDAAQFEEDPSGKTLFQETLALRLRFSGWGLVEMATDPDPPTDETGATGTHMLHAADGPRGMDRYLYFQANDPERNILRAPREALPAIGVNCTEVALVVAKETATAGYVPLSVMSSSGAVQTQGVQQRVEVKGLDELLRLSPADILGKDRKLRVDLLFKDGVGPFLQGYNHLVSKDGEPIDPFIFALLADGDDGQPKPIVQREIYNEGKSFMDMSPLQRLETSRWPVGFDSVANIPLWALDGMSQQERSLLKGPGYPGSYLAARGGVLGAALARELAGTPGHDQQVVDSAVSLAERMARIAVPRPTTLNWLRYILHYGHTLSGKLTVSPSGNPILAALRERTGLDLDLNTGANRSEPNGRWLLSYTKGIMDTDALADYVYGELYIPLAVKGSDDTVTFTRTWSFPAAMRGAVLEYAVRFNAPFWADFTVDGDFRSTKLDDGTTIREMLDGKSLVHYHYLGLDLHGVKNYNGSFTLASEADTVKLTWAVKWKAEDPTTHVKVAAWVARIAQTMTARMAAHFGPSCD